VDGLKVEGVEMTTRGPLPHPDARRVRTDRIRLVVDASHGRPPACPRHLSDDEKRVWNEASKALRADGRFGQGHGPILERYAVAVTRARLVDATIASDGLMVNGRAHPLLTMATTLANRVRALARELGLTPAARLPAMKDTRPPDRAADASPVASMLRAAGRFPAT
jgi:P27 family predicted phage terminase small subunit